MFIKAVKILTVCRLLPWMHCIWKVHQSRQKVDWLIGLDCVSRQRISQNHNLRVNGINISFKRTTLSRFRISDNSVKDEAAATNSTVTERKIAHYNNHVTTPYKSMTSHWRWLQEPPTLEIQTRRRDSA
ncbi:hypothetical protein AVEN_103056-1 [Araneus ventricosus]|uniref:Uncharacterized protein n=1 Tax=Araneus ventricosus TaxID=182803 RepID=A0A4Y2B886_ARAVE|nr:hypothetical protein AVEN_103056-1 [Araneus ventricosus]